MTEYKAKHFKLSGPGTRGSGFTLIECMVLLVVFTIVSVGVGVGLQSTTRVPHESARAMAISSELTSEMEAWRAVAFGASPWPATLPYNITDTVTVSAGGQTITYNRKVSIQNWDPANLSSNASPQTDFVRIVITINNQSIVAYITAPV